MHVHRLLPLVVAAGCAPRPQTTPTDAPAQRRGHSADARKDAESPPRTTPVPPEFPPSRGFEALPAEIVWTCDSHAVTLPGTTPSIILDAESLATIAEGARETGCDGPPPSIDFDHFVLAWTSLSFTSRISYVAMREGAVELGVTTQAYCGGPRPPGPEVWFIAVPRSAKTVATVPRDVGKCEGPPRP